MADGSIRFFTDLSTAGFESGAKRLQNVSASASASIQGAFTSVGAAITRLVAPLLTVYTAINSVKNALNMTDRLSELSKATGETAGNLALLERAFENTGIGAEKVGPMFAKMSSFISDLAAQTPKAAETASVLGVSLEQLKGKTPTDQFQILLQAVAGVADENMRAATAGDIFGDKMGYKLVPFARDFIAEMQNAREELGSTVRLLNENASGMDNIGDKLSAITAKLTEFTIGLASGTAGANDLVEALAKIDAAGLGERIGQALRAAFAAPIEVVQGIGEILIAGVLEAGNRLKAAMEFAVNSYFNMISNPGFYSGLTKFLEGMFAKVGQGLAFVIIESIKFAIGMLNFNPLWRPFIAEAQKQLEIIQKTVEEAGIRASVGMKQGSMQMTAAFKEGVKDAEYIYEDALGSKEHYIQGLQHFENARIAAQQIAEESATIEQNFQKGSAALTKALNAIRGFNLTGGGAPLPSPFPSWNQPKGGPLAPPGGGGGLPAPSPSPAPTGGGGRAGGGAPTPLPSGPMTTAQLVSSIMFQGRPANNIGEAWQGAIQNNFNNSKMAALNWLRSTPTFNPQTSEEQNLKNAFLSGAFPTQPGQPNQPPAPGGGAAGGTGAGAGPGGQGAGPGGSPGLLPGKPFKESLETTVNNIYTLLDERLPIQALV